MAAALRPGGLLFLAAPRLRRGPPDGDGGGVAAAVRHSARGVGAALLAAGLCVDDVAVAGGGAFAAG